MSYDEQHNDGLGGRSRNRREITESWRWGEQLVALPKWHTDAIPMPDDLRKRIDDCRLMTSKIALKRQINHIDSYLRDMDEDARALVNRGIHERPQGVDPDSIVKSWLPRLKTEGDAAIDAFLEAYPAAERQRLRQCVRSGKDLTIERYVREFLGPA